MDSNPISFLMMRPNVMAFLAEFFPYVIHGAFHFFARFVLEVFAGKKGKLLSLIFRAQIDGCNSKHSDGVAQVPGLFDDRDSGICDVFCQIGRVI